MIEAKPETLIGDHAYDSDPLDDDLRKDVSKWSHRIDPIAASALRKMDADSGDMRGAGWSNGSSLGFNGNARILVRWEFYPKNFLGFVQLACLAVLFKRF